MRDAKLKIGETLEKRLGAGVRIPLGYTWLPKFNSLENREEWRAGRRHWDKCQILQSPEEISLRGFTLCNRGTVAGTRKDGSSEWTRTTNITVNSRTLCRLSYRGSLYGNVTSCDSYNQERDAWSNLQNAKFLA